MRQKQDNKTAMMFVNIRALIKEVETLNPNYPIVPAKMQQIKMLCEQIKMELK